MRQTMKKRSICATVGWRLALAVVLMWMWAVPSVAQTDDIRITIEQKGMSVRAALSSIERQSGLRFMYDESVLRGKERVDMQFKEAPLKKVLDGLCGQLSLRWEIDRRVILLLPVQRAKAIVSKDNSVVLMGTVKDASDEPLVGANIKVTSGDRIFGTIADHNGEFRLTFEPEANRQTQIAVSFIGYTTQQLAFRGQSRLDIVLEESRSVIDEVVVTGYQTISKERAAGSYNIIKGEDVTTKAISANSIIDALEGLTTGLSINRAYGADRYLIRGATSINSTRSPLFVVDGVPLDESLVEDMINSNDIASVTILKDATAASIWGSQAANGVVVISTKRGQNNQKVKISYNGSFSWYGKPDYGYYHYMDAATFMRNAQEIFDEYSERYSYSTVQNTAAGYAGATHDLAYNSYMPMVWPHEVAMYEYKEGLISQEERDSRLAALMAQDGRGQYEDYFMDDKWYTQHNVSLRGGSQRHTYFLSLNYKGDRETNTSWTDKVTINAYQDYQLAKWLKWDLTVNATFGNAKGHLSPWNGSASKGTTLEEIYAQMNNSSGATYYNLPYNIFKDENGWVDQSPMVMSPVVRESAEAVTGIDLGFYPVDDFRKSMNETTSTNLRVNTGLTVNLLKGLTYEGRFQYSRIHSRQETFRPSDSYIVREERAQTYDTSENKLRVPSTGGHYMLNNALTTDWTVRNQLKYDASFDEGNHLITALAGTEVRSYVYTSYQNMYRGYDMQTMLKQSYDNYGIAQSGWIMPVPIGSYATIRTGEYDQSETSKRYFSLYANAAYTYLHKYTLNASIRMDQSNLFGSDPSTQYKPIWSVGAAWRISDEPFMQEVKAIDHLTLRASYGLAGNSPNPGTGGKYDILSATNSTRFENPGFDIVTPANDMLTWEKTRIINAGFDIHLLDYRLGVSFDYYDKYTEDLIGLVNLNPTSGWLSTTGNLGEMSNRGFELTLNTHNIKTRDFNWYTTFTLSYNKNKIEKLDVESPIETANDLRFQSYVEGYPMGALFSYRYAGLNNEGKPQAYDKDGNIVSGYDVDYLTKDDVVYSGTTIPKYYGGLTNRFSYKNLDLSFLFVYNMGHKMRKDGIYFYGRTATNLPEEFDRRWRQPGDEAFTDVPRYTVSIDRSLAYSLYYYADTRVLDASYIRLRDVTLSYTLPKSFCQKLRVDNIRLTAQFGNLWLIAFNDEDIDPEAYAYGGYYYARQDKYGPSYSFGINIDF